MALGDKKNVPWSVNGILADAGGDIKVAAASIPTAGGASIETALSTKANMTSEICPDLDTFIEVNKYMAVTSDTQNRPALAVVDFGRVINIGTDSTTFLQILYARGSAILYRGYAAWETPKFHRWRMVTDNTPPQEHPLPLAAGVMAREGLTSLCRYSKDGFGRVCVHFSVVKVNESAFTSMESIATLPAGCRPSDIVYGVAAAHASSPISNCGFGVHPDGRIVIYPANDTDTKNLAGTIIFTAG